MIGSARLRAEVASGDSITPRGMSVQMSTLDIDGAWPNLPGKPTGYAPTSSIEVAPGQVTHNEDGSYGVVGRFKIDEGGFFDDPNAFIEYWLDSIGMLELTPQANETAETLIVSSLRVTGTEAGEPYVCDFSVEYFADAGAGRTRAALDGMIARSTFKGGRGMQDIRKFMAAQAA